MDNSRTATWEAILSLSHTMAELAERQEWEAVLQKEIERRAVIGSFFDQPVSEADAPQVAVKIQNLMEMDKALVSIFEQARTETAKQIGNATKGRKMDAAYRSNT